MHVPGSLARVQPWIAPALTGPPLLAFLPALSLGAFWLGGERALLLIALGLPLVLALAGSFGGRLTRAQARDGVTGLFTTDGFAAQVDRIATDMNGGSLRSVCLVLELEELKEAIGRHGAAAGDQLAQQAGERIVSALRQGDIVARLGETRFGVCLKPVRQLDLELCIQLAGRLQVTIEEPILIDGLSVYLSCTIGFCAYGRAPGTDGKSWIDAAAAALSEAKRHGPSSIRNYTGEQRSGQPARPDLLDDAASALENGQIQPWFQPQISTDTGRVTGFEALARWTHPKHGVIGPDEFLPVLEETGLIERLGQVVLFHALTALRVWDNAGADVPCIAVNFTSSELRNPTIVDRIKWELDRFDLTPDRLAVEILETVVTDSPDDSLTRTVRGLGKLGCRIDLDDFGTGHASIAAIRRFDIRRIKIDRCFIAKADQDPEQQRMIGAILSMAEHLGIETLAEGVETAGEHTLLAQLGCTHVQGFGVARPMPVGQTLDWIAAHEAKLAELPPYRSRGLTASVRPPLSRPK